MIQKKLWLLAVCLLSLSSIAVSKEQETSLQVIPTVLSCGRQYCYWETPMDIQDTDAVWNMLISPITVLKGDQRENEFLYGEPSKDSAPVGEVTCYSQGVHVLENRPDGWSYIECYSSSFHNSKIKAWNQLVQGYVPTTLLIEKSVKTKYGLVCDKLTQRLYIFKKGELLDTLLISTGLPNEKQPFNETRSGEFILCSRTGAFTSDNLICDMAIRFNDLDLLHEVPHQERADGSRDYKICEQKLGARASHGCIRVQRLRTPKGINMKWLWNEMRDEMGTRLIIWEDVPERFISLPDPDIVLYYNSKGGENYHNSPTCYGVRDEYLPMAEFTYADLDSSPYDKLTACPYCNPPLRLVTILEINARHVT